MWCTEKCTTHSIERKPKDANVRACGVKKKLTIFRMRLNDYNEEKKIFEVRERKKKYMIGARDTIRARQCLHTIPFKDNKNHFFYSNFTFP